MTRIYLLLVSTALLFSVGCKQNPYVDVYVDSLNAEKRVLEDRIFELEYENEKIQRELDSFRGGERPSGTERIELPVPRQDPGDDTEGTDPDELDLSPPTINPGNSNDDSGSRNQPRRNDDSVLKDDGDSVASIYINPTQTGGANLDEMPGDEGVTLAIEPRDQFGRYLPAAGKMTVELVDPSDTKTSLALWEFDARETELAMHRADSGRGIRLKMRLPDEPREADDLQLVVRFWAPSGRVFTAKHPLQLMGEQDVSARWTPRQATDAIDGSSPTRPANVAEQPRVVKPGEPSPSPRKASRDGTHGDNWTGRKAAENKPAWRPYR